MLIYEKEADHERRERKLDDNKWACIDSAFQSAIMTISAAREPFINDEASVDHAMPAYVGEMKYASRRSFWKSSSTKY